MSKFVTYIILTICVTIGGILPGLLGWESSFGIWSFLGGLFGLIIGIVVISWVAKRYF